MSSSDSRDDKDSSDDVPSLSKILQSKKFDRRTEDKKPNPQRRVTDADWTRYTNRIRDVFFLILGLGGTANQLFYANPPNPVLYPILAGLLGAPFAFALDQRRREHYDKEN